MKDMVFTLREWYYRLQAVDYSHNVMMIFVIFFIFENGTFFLINVFENFFRPHCILDESSKVDGQSE